MSYLLDSLSRSEHAQSPAPERLKRRRAAREPVDPSVSAALPERDLVDTLTLNSVDLPHEGPLLDVKELDLDADNWRISKLDADTAAKWQRVRYQGFVFRGMVAVSVVLGVALLSLNLSANWQDTQRSVQQQWQQLQQQWLALSHSVQSAKAPIDLQLVDAPEAAQPASLALISETLPEPSTSAAIGSARKAAAPSPAPETVQIVFEPVQDSPIARLALAQQAYSAFERAEFSQAKAHYQRLLALDPDDRNAWLGLAASELSLAEVDSAKQRYEQLLLRWPGDAAAEQGLRYIDQAAAAKAALQKRHQRALSFARERRWPEAARAYHIALSEQPSNPNIAFNLAVVYEHLGDTQQALQYYQQALSLHSSRGASFDQALATARVKALTVP